MYLWRYIPPFFCFKEVNHSLRTFVALQLVNVGHHLLEKQRRYLGISEVKVNHPCIFNFLSSTQRNLSHENKWVFFLVTDKN